MKSGLNKRTVVGGDIYETIQINVWDVETKAIIFTGNSYEAARFLGVQQGNVTSALKRKNRIRKKYAVRYVKSETK